ncbi:uncharacterized protein LOC132870694 [Neoarius graeffei]|uniref:uncharacterized protein LOC132870694 n=1 Tax=Neoarius graeffei TaxID=443677 RepID=UPI00298D3089|nr:uncharacterized protein LOC132870694 [Neoarius graeffei]
MANATKGSKVIIQSSQKIQAFSELFYIPVVINHQVQLEGMLDSGSMACTISGPAVEKLRCAGVLPEKQHPEENIVLIGCGGRQTQPEGLYELKIQIYGTCCIVPTLVVPSQPDDLIIGSNVIKHLMHDLKSDSKYWDIVSSYKHQSNPDIDHFLSMFTSVEQWKGQEIPEKVGTVKLTQAVTLLPRHEHLVWGRLPPNVPMSPGSTVMVEPTGSKAQPRGVLVGRLVTPLWGDRAYMSSQRNNSQTLLTVHVLAPNLQLRWQS